MFKCNQYNIASLILGLLLGVGALDLMAAAPSYQLSTGETLYDPTTPAGWGVAHRATPSIRDMRFTLNYIRLSAGHKRAMINGRSVTVGDRISGAMVKKIKLNSVTLLLNGKTKVLKLNKILRLSNKTGSK